jgi:hypothetical protein
MSETRVTVVLLTNMGSWVVAIVVAVLTYVFTKMKEREADWRKVKLELYKELHQRGGWDSRRANDA